MEASMSVLNIGIIYFFVWIVGLAFGSFATMASYRLPLGKEMVKQRSHCPKCKHNLGVIDLVPVFSWLFSFGRCRYCKKNISFRYPLTELVTGFMFVAIFAQFGCSLTGVVLLLLAVCLVIMIVIDFEHKIIPDQIQLALAVIGLLYWFSIGGNLSWIIFGPLIYGGFAILLRYVFWLWKRKEALGMGDVKFFAVMGLYLDFYAFAPFLLYSGLFGVLTGMIWKRLGKGDEFPFGPALAISLLFCVIFREYAVFNYAGLINH